MKHLPGFEIKKTLFAEGQNVVCKAMRLSDNVNVILKVVYSELLDDSNLIKLRREYNILSLLELKCVPATLDLHGFNGGLAIVMEDHDEVDLSTIIPSNGMLLHEFLFIASQLISALGELHSKGLVHKDVKPQNILINPETLILKIIDFGVSIQIDQETVSLVSYRQLEGTLNYISPEQTGRMNCPLDYRSDFYSLGVTLYELVTGMLPFVSSDPMEVLHSHLAVLPKAPAEVKPNIPQVVSDIILKLLEKSPENRYQSARGLQFDIDKCIVTLSEEGIIEYFPIGVEDYSNRFNIPQKLFGREKEINLLLNSFDTVSKGGKALVMVSGFSGIGKTKLINEIHKPIVEKRGYFITGKYEQFQKDIPYLGMNLSLRSLIRQILAENEHEIEKWRIRMQNSLGLNGRIMTEVNPELEMIIGPQPEISTLPPSESQNRFNLVFLQFVQSLSSQEQPLVVFLDDLQWADTPTFKLLELLLSDQLTKNLLIIGAYRDNEVSSSDPLHQMVTNVKQQFVNVAEIALKALELNDLNVLVSESLLCNKTETQDLSNLIYTKTAGNPFFANEFLKSLHKQNLITFKYVKKRWEWDINIINKQQITDNVAEMMGNQLALLDTHTQYLCQLAACIGNKFSLNTLATVYQHSVNQTAKDLYPAIQAGLVLPIGTNYRFAEISQSSELNSSIEYRFSHDRVQQAAYSFNSETEKQSTHLKIGRLLNDSYSIDQRKEFLFDIVSHFNSASSLITEENELIEVVQMNLDAGKRAKASTAYEPSFQFLLYAKNFLPSDVWTTHYELALEVYSEQAECAYLVGDFDLMESQVNIILKQSKDVIHTAKAYIIKIQAYLSLLKIEKALDIALEALAKLGIPLQKTPHQGLVIFGLLKSKYLLRNMTTNDLEHLPVMTEPKRLAQMLILSASTSPSYFVSPTLFPLVIFKQVELSLKYGNCPDSSYAYSTYGLILCGVTNEFDKGEQFGILALNLLKKYNLELFKAKIHFIYGQFISHWTKSYNSLYNYATLGLQSGLEHGDFLFGAYCGYAHINGAIYASMPINEIIDLAEQTYLPILRKTNQKLPLNWVLMHYDMLQNFNSSEELNFMIKGIADSEEELVKALKLEKEFSGLCNFNMNKMTLHYHMGDPLLGLMYGDQAMDLIENVLATPQVSNIIYYHTLSMIKALPYKSKLVKFRLRLKINRNVEKMEKFAKASPENQMARLHIIQGELQRIKGSSPVVLYENAIKHAQSNGLLQVEALAFELLGRYYLNQKDLLNTKNALLSSRRAYFSGGVLAKVKLLDQEFELLYRDTTPKQGNLSKLGTSFQTGSYQTNNIEFDMVSVMKSSVAISSEIVLDKLLDKLMKVVIENAGAQKGYLLLTKGKTWHIMAGGSVDNIDQYQAKGPLIGNSYLPESIVNYVIRTNTYLVIYNVKDDPLFARDPIVNQENLNSILCLPIQYQGTLIGILYLENSLNSGVFTDQRVEFLKLLSGQIAVSLQNALNYENLEQKVKERTLDIETEKEKVETTLKQLKLTQAQLVQNEKLASLGELTAGIAHEIQNPLNFVNNFSQINEELVSEITEEINKAVSDRNDDLIIENLTYLTDNLQKTQQHGKRASNIINGMLEHSRASKGEQKLTDINELITEFVKLSFHGFRAKEKSFNSDFKTDLDQNIGKVNIIPQDIGRVLLNLFNNGFQSIFSESKSREALGEKSFAPLLLISTRKLDNQFVITIKDNGKGIPEKILDKIFQPFFTTKPAGEGTGLGLSLAYDIINAHGGKLDVFSIEGEGATFSITLPINSEN